MHCPKCKAETGKQAGYDRHEYIESSKIVYRLYCQHCKWHNVWDYDPNQRGDGGGGPPIPDPNLSAHAGIHPHSGDHHGGHG